MGDKEMLLCVYTEGYTRSRYQVSVLSHSQAITASLWVLLTAKITLLRCPSEPLWLTSAVAPARVLLPPKMIWSPPPPLRHGALVREPLWHARLGMEKKESWLSLIVSKWQGNGKGGTSVRQRGREQRRGTRTPNHYLRTTTNTQFAAAPIILLKRLPTPSCHKLCWKKQSKEINISEKAT